MANERTRLEQLRRWRQAAVWAPVVWFPLIVYSLSVGRLGFVVTLVFAGAAFAAVCGAVVWFGRCPRCGIRFGGSSVGFRSIWDDSTCGSCGLSLFELRRRDSPSR